MMKERKIVIRGCYVASDLCLIRLAPIRRIQSNEPKIQK